jgi:hypothetical protein
MALPLESRYGYIDEKNGLGIPDIGVPGRYDNTLFMPFLPGMPESTSEPQRSEKFAQPVTAPGRLEILSSDFSEHPGYRFDSPMSKDGQLLRFGAQANGDIYGREDTQYEEWAGGKRTTTVGIADNGEWESTVVDLKLSTFHERTTTTYDRIDTPGDTTKKAEYQITDGRKISEEPGAIAVRLELHADGRYALLMRMAVNEAVVRGLVPALGPREQSVLEAALLEDESAKLEERVNYTPAEGRNGERVGKMLTLSYRRRAENGGMLTNMLSRSDTLYQDGESEYQHPFTDNTASPISFADQARHASYMAEHARMPEPGSRRALQIPIYIRPDTDLVPA